MTIERISVHLPQMTAPDCFSCEACGVVIECDNARRYDGKVVLCPTCGAGYFQERREERKRFFMDRYRDLVGRGLIRENFLAAGFQNSDKEVEILNPQAWRTAREWPRSQNLYIHGPVGTGKSFLALCALRKAFVDFNGHSVAEVSGRRFCKASDRFDEGGGMFHEWRRAKVLLIDDMDKADWNPARLSALWEILDDRMVCGRRTVVTANVAPAAIRDMLRQQAGSNTSMADAALDRLKPCTTIELKGKSLR